MTTDIRITGGVDTLYRVWVDGAVRLETDDVEEAQTEAMEQRAQRSVEARVERIEEMVAVLLCTTPSVPVDLQVQAFNRLPVELRERLTEATSG